MGTVREKYVREREEYVGEEYAIYRNREKDFELTLEQFTEAHNIHITLDDDFPSMFTFPQFANGLTTVTRIAKLIIVCDGERKRLGRKNPVKPPMVKMIVFLTNLIKVQYLQFGGLLDVAIAEEYARYGNLVKDFELPLEQFTEAHNLYGKLAPGFTEMFTFTQFANGLTTVARIDNLILICSRRSKRFGQTQPVEQSMTDMIVYLDGIKRQFQVGGPLDVDMVVSEVMSRLFHT
jgi:hypothetical protein